MKPRDYCCCAIPTTNAGIYATLAEQFTLGILVGTLSWATPSIVGASVPSFAPWILAIISYVGAAVQLLGFLGVFKEKAILFRRYTTVHILLTVAAFAVAAVWIIISATKHNAADTKCQNDFFSDTDDPTGATSSEGQTLCNIFTWVDVGLMSGLWVVLAIMQFYLYTVVSGYGTGQRRDHAQYKSIYSVTNFNSDIPLSTNRGDPWDARPSLDEGVPIHQYGHARNESTASVSTILGEKEQQPRDFSYNYGDTAPSAYPPQRQRTYTSARQGSTDDAYLSHPSTAYPQYGGPSANYAGGYQPQPDQGFSGRKPSLLQKQERRGLGDFDG